MELPCLSMVSPQVFTLEQTLSCSREGASGRLSLGKEPPVRTKRLESGFDADCESGGLTPVCRHPFWVALMESFLSFPRRSRATNRWTGLASAIWLSSPSPPARAL